ncbi:MAG TPA: DUF5522 domain-containing protein [Terracidiphilus sp.]|nr:DUF5522 domain-containing protein [Terracidiphilus sp.]
MDPNPPEGAAKPQSPLAPEDYYYDGPYLVFTEAYHRKRGYCCNSGCRHCPYRAPEADAPAPEGAAG